METTMDDLALNFAATLGKAGLHRDGPMPDPLTVKPSADREALIAALIAVAKEFRELAEHARKAAKKLGAEDAFDTWEKANYKRLLDALHKHDLLAAQLEMAAARRSLNALLDEATIARALGEHDPQRTRLGPRAR